MDCQNRRRATFENQPGLGFQAIQAPFGDPFGEAPPDAFGHEQHQSAERRRRQGEAGRPIGIPAVGSKRFCQDRRQKGDLVTRVTGDVDAVGTLFSQQLGEVAQSALLAFGMVVVVMWIDPVLGLISIATLPFMLLLSAVFRRRVKSQSRVRRAQDGQIASLANEALSAMAVVKAFGSERFEGEVPTPAGPLAAVCRRTDAMGALARRPEPWRATVRAYRRTADTALLQRLTEELGAE